jgi:hypothetical protein
MFSQDKIIIDKSCENIIRQIQTWALKNDSPDDKNCGYCECLCLIISELKKKHVFEKNETRIVDYKRGNKNDELYY